MAKLTKQLGLPDVFSIAAGAMISSGLFILPALAYSKAGPAVILSYLIASLIILPSVLSKAELATAMPRAGGTYFFVERSFGSFFGLFTGFAGWFSLALKSAFAIVGMALIIETIFDKQFNEIHFKAISVTCCVIFTVLNIVSVKHASKLQIVLVAILLLTLSIFIFFGIGATKTYRYSNFMDKGWLAIFSTAGLVFVSYGGLTKVASVGEEVKNPGRNIPLGMILAWFVVTLLYIAVVTITIGVFDKQELVAVVNGTEQIQTNLPISDAASKFMGLPGFIMLSIAAIAAFVTTANGGILAASRCPMAMSRDGLLPPALAHINHKFKTPHLSIILTAGFMIAALVFLDIESLVKTASTLMILLFILDNASVIIMRESKIQSYRPQFKSPLYPYVHIIALLGYGFLIIDMGKIPLLITVGFFVFSIAWYYLYASSRVSRASAAMHIVERVTSKDLKTVTLENELRDILIERDEIIEDRFDKLIKECKILDIEGRKTAEQVFKTISKILEKRLDVNEYVLFEKFLKREEEGGTVVQPGLAIPHIVIEGQHKFDVLLVRARNGIKFAHTSDPVSIMFVLAGTKDERNYHLRALMAIAQIAQEKHFEHRWLSARDTETIRNIILLSTRTRDMKE
ncbi:MAG: amino acid permease [Sedimentisphaerales bacterium]|nr:amino acid permease [Sedimentisphaerales bacterium]